MNGIAFALQACASCLSGAQLRVYSLTGGTASGDVVPVNDPTLTGVVAAAQPAGGMAAAFSVPLPDGATPQALPLIFASGSVYASNSRLRRHEDYGSAFLNLQTGQLTDTEWSDDGTSALVAVSALGAGQQGHPAASCRHAGCAWPLLPAS